MVKIISWNLNGIRSVLKKELWYPFVESESPDIICLQEVRALPSQFKFTIEFNKEYPYQYFHNPTVKKGYSGTAILSKIKPINVIHSDIDSEGRVITAEFEDYYLVCVYVPNSGSKFEYRVNEWDHLFRKYLESLNKKVIICGDFNVASNKIDIHNPKIKNVAGVTPEEKENFGLLLETFVDTFRTLYPEKIKFSWWSVITKARLSNKGWRIDYFLVSKGFEYTESDILTEIMGSDHAPCMFKFET